MIGPGTAVTPGRAAVSDAHELWRPDGTGRGACMKSSMSKYPAGVRGREAPACRQRKGPPCFRKS